MKVILVVSSVLILAACQTSVSNLNVSSFEECVAAGNPVMESFPEKCKTPDGRQFIREIQEPTTRQLSEDCAAENGNWLPDYHECEYISESWCIDKEGHWLECESACRHDPEAEICTLQCVPICKF